MLDACIPSPVPLTPKLFTSVLNSQFPLSCQQSLSQSPPLSQLKTCWYCLQFYQTAPENSPRHQSYLRTKHKQFKQTPLPVTDSISFQNEIQPHVKTSSTSWSQGRSDCILPSQLGSNPNSSYRLTESKFLADCWNLIKMGNWPR